MNVLSLFDGMSCGQIALEKAGIKVDNYFASEIDKHAIQITQKNYPNTIQLGDVTKWYEWDLPEIDLLLAGSPCQGFSVSGKGLNFSDPRSKLFFVFSDVLNAVKPKHFLLENVKMKKRWEEIITNSLCVHPIEINSSLVSAQSRKRLYWTNIPNVSQPEDKRLLLKDVLEDEYTEKEVLSEKIQERFQFIESNYAIGTTKPDFRTIGQRDYVFGENQKMGCLVATDFKQPKQVYHNGVLRKASPLECERLQTVPDNYTKGVSNTQRYKMLGNGWTVDVIAHIFKGLKEEYITKEITLDSSQNIQDDELNIEQITV
ncbi:DNA (cytosine-5-)-methyltransferase [Bacillus subtilis]|uniref:DNA (cytosine-5-)-methyltransferase n=1 Tax=Bacillus subtilis TaxID=1423 RepID=UPI003F871F36